MKYELFLSFERRGFLIISTKDRKRACIEFEVCVDSILAVGRSDGIRSSVHGASEHEFLVIMCLLFFSTARLVCKFEPLQSCFRIKYNPVIYSFPKHTPNDCRFWSRFVDSQAL